MEEGREAISLIKREKSTGPRTDLAEHIGGLERSYFCDFKNSRKRAYSKEKFEYNEQSKEASQNKFVKKGGMPDRVESFKEINSRENRPRAQPGFVKSMRNGMNKEQNLI